MSAVRCPSSQFLRFLLVSSLMLGFWAGQAQAEEWKTQNGGIDPGKLVLGMRAGFAPLTQTLSSDTSTAVGSLVNFQAMYSLNNWLLVGMMLEWERHGIDQERPTVDLGHQDTVSVLPTVEVRPIRFGPISPYANMSFGVNVNSFGESSAIRGNTISPSNTFAWRLGWGADYMLTKQVAVNAEMAYKRNDGHVTVNGTRDNDCFLPQAGRCFNSVPPLNSPHLKKHRPTGQNRLPVFTIGREIRPNTRMDMIHLAFDIKVAYLVYLARDGESNDKRSLPSVRKNRKTSRTRVKCSERRRDRTLVDE
jgi:opacity protein-like surface antigen